VKTLFRIWATFAEKKDKKASFVFWIKKIPLTRGRKKR